VVCGDVLVVDLLGQVQKQVLGDIFAYLCCMWHPPHLGFMLDDQSTDDLFYTTIAKVELHGTPICKSNVSVCSRAVFHGQSSSICTQIE